MVEQRPFKALVAGSSPAQPTLCKWCSLALTTNADQNLKRLYSSCVPIQNQRDKVAIAQTKRAVVPAYPNDTDPVPAFVEAE